MAMEELVESFTEHTSAPAPAAPAAPVPSAPVSAPAAPAPSSAPVASPAPQAKPAEGRDKSGRFSPKAPAVMAPAPQPAVSAPAAQQFKAPASWSPEEREAWETMNPRHQQAVSRREREIQQALQSSAQARQFQQEIVNVVQPYMPMIQAEGSDPVRAIASLMQTAATLRTAPAMTKAGLLADLILQHQVDIPMLDSALRNKIQGLPAPNDPANAMMRQFDARLAPIMQFIDQQQRQQNFAAQRVTQQAETTLAEFMANPANEFAPDVALDMADYLEMAANRGQILSLQDAYRRATMAHPEISKIMERRMLEGGAAQQNAAAQRAQHASASITDSGTPSQSANGAEDTKSVRSALIASVRDLANRR